MQIYRLDKPHPVLISHGKLQIIPIRNPNEPVSGYALQNNTHSVELSFDELARIAAANKEMPSKTV